MLREWAEGGYSPKNKPYPQGEILISGANVTEGYLNNPEKTAEDFIDINGRRWFCTGDIGQFLPDGCLKIIDRKKDLLKLKHGEYISLNKVEATLLTSPLIDNICVYGNPDTMYLVALVVPNRKNLEKLSKKMNIDPTDFEVLRNNKEICKAFLSELQEHAKQNKLDKIEIPEKLYLCKEMWTVDMGLLTDALKLKRKPIEKFYEDILKKLYAN
jgi:long-chain acyl-CoA synthetase